MKQIRLGLIVALACVWAAPAGAAMHWQPAPHQNGAMHHDRMAAKQFQLADAHGADAILLHPDLKQQNILLDRHGMLAFKPTGKNSYHALIASRDYGNITETAIRYVYLHGKPSGVSPSLLTGHEKSALEIEPSPLAREHWRYYSNTNAQFVVRFHAEPLSGANIIMETGNGSRAEFTADGEGRVIVPLPEDFAYEKPGRSANPPSEFVLTVRHSAGDQRHITTFSNAYHVNPQHWQSTQLGLAMIGGGMLIGGFITLRKRRRKEKI